MLYEVITPRLLATIAWLKSVGHCSYSTIEAVVDRAVIKTGQQQRLAESFETAIELAEGLVKVVA